MTELNLKSETAIRSGPINGGHLGLLSDDTAVDGICS